MGETNFLLSLLGDSAMVIAAVIVCVSSTQVACDVHALRTDLGPAVEGHATGMTGTADLFFLKARGVIASKE